MEELSLASQSFPWIYSLRQRNNILSPKNKQASPSIHAGSLKNYTTRNTVSGSRPIQAKKWPTLQRHQKVLGQATLAKRSDVRPPILHGHLLISTWWPHLLFIDRAWQADCVLSPVSRKIGAVLGDAGSLGQSPIITNVGCRERHWLAHVSFRIKSWSVECWCWSVGRSYKTLHGAISEYYVVDVGTKYGIRLYPHYNNLTMTTNQPHYPTIYLYYWL